MPQSSTLVVFELVVGLDVDPRRRGGAALQELRGVALLASFARFPRLTHLSWLAHRPFRRIASNLGLQLHDVDEMIGLAARLVRGHRRARGEPAQSHKW